MGNPTLAVYCFGFELNKIRYPWRESLTSALTLANHVYFCECGSQDGTYEDLMTFIQDMGVSNKVTVLRHSWEGDYRVQAVIANKLLDEIGTKYDYALKLDMDEVIHEKSFGVFHQQLGLFHSFGAALIRPHYTHFSPDFDTVFPFIYDSKAVISRTELGLRYSLGHGGDACAIGGAEEHQSQLEIYHYGKVATGREKEALYKEVSFTAKYVELGFPDPKVASQVDVGWLDYNKVFDVARARGDFKPFTGTHPVFMRSWIDMMRERSVEFWKDKK